MEQTLNSGEIFRPAYSLGKIHNKHLILEILGFCQKSKKLLQLMFHASKNMRHLLIKNFKIFKKINKYVIPSKINDFDNTAVERFGVNFKVYQKLLAVIYNDF